MSGLEVVGDCSHKCRSAQHTGELVRAASQDVDEDVLIAWLARHCHSPGRYKDPFGRSLLHIAASRGKIKLLQWLLKYKEAAINSKDVESGYSGLHRAMYFGRIQTVVFLIQQGANLSLTDNTGLTALDHALQDRPPHVTYSKNAPLDVYVWGSNSNYNLGLGNNSTRNNPDLVEQFRRQSLCVVKVVLQKFHSAFLTRTGSVLTCGHGRGGRLGHGSETMQLTPRPVPLTSCTDVALGVDHSVFLCEGGLVFTCGENSYHQLGHQPPPPRLLAPAPVTGGGRGGAMAAGRALGVAAGRFHSVAWTEEAVFTWGLNAGQLGHIRGEKTVVLPKQVAALAGKDTKIEQVAVSDGATVVLTSKGEVVALHQYSVKKLGARQHGVAKIQVVGGHLDPGVDPGGGEDIEFKLVAGGGTSLRVYLLSRIGKITVWEETRENSFLPCLFSLSRPAPSITDMAVYRDGMILVSEDGESWSASCGPLIQPPVSASRKAAASPSNKQSGKKTTSSSILLKLRRIAHTHRAALAACDPKGRNFAVLQVSPTEALTEIPEVGPPRLLDDVATLLAEVNEYDHLHDTVVIVGKERFPLHSFVLASGSESLCKQLKFTETLNPAIVQVEDVDPVIFRQVVQYIYTRKCDLLQEGECNIEVSSLQSGGGTKHENQNVEEDLDVTNPQQVSAFSVYQERNRKQGKGNRRGAATGQQQQGAPTPANRKGTAAAAAARGKPAAQSNPLTVLQESARNLGVYGLAKLAEYYRYSEGRIVSRSATLQPPTPRLSFDPNSLPELCDVTIETEDGEEIGAHKCILAARSEYFNGMFSSCWIDTSQDSSIKLPMKAEVVETVLEFLYTDDSVTVTKSDDTEFLSSILVVSDQLLLTRLKELCENQMSRCVSLKNVADMLEFSCIYLANQLKATCMQFICLNLPALLETRSLESLEEETFSHLDTYYRSSNPLLHNRSLPSYSGFPDRESILAEYARSPLTWEEVEAMEEANTRNKTRIRRNSSGDKKSWQRDRKSSVESSGSDSEDGVTTRDMDKLSVLDFDIEEKEEEEEVSPKLGPATSCPPTSVDKQLLNSTATAAAVGRDRSFFAAILSGVSGGGGTNDAEVGSPQQIGKAGGVDKEDDREKKSPSPPSLTNGSSQNNNSHSINNNNNNNNNSNHISSSTPRGKKFPKLSQKERKRQEATTADTTTKLADSPKPGETKAPWGGWGGGQHEQQHHQLQQNGTTATPSLTLIMQREEEGVAVGPGGTNLRTRDTGPTSIGSGDTARTRRSSDGDSKPSESPVKKSAWKKIDLANIDAEINPPPRVSSISNPWNLSSPPSAPPPAWNLSPSPAGPSVVSPASLSPSGGGQGGVGRNRSFSQIMAEETKETEILYKVQSKALSITQIEEKAIEELRIFYNVENVKDEIISVARVERGVAATPVWKKYK